MPLSEKTKNLLLMPFAVSPILDRFALPGIVGMVLIIIGVLQNVGWLQVVGVVLAAPVFWCYAVVIFIYFPFLAYERLRRGKKKASGIS